MTEAALISLALTIFSTISKMRAEGRARTTAIEDAELSAAHAALKASGDQIQRDAHELARADTPPGKSGCEESEL